jgi:hypothetical protein
VALFITSCVTYNSEDVGVPFPFTARMPTLLFETLPLTYINDPGCAVMNPPLLFIVCPWLLFRTMIITEK